MFWIMCQVDTYPFIFRFMRRRILSTPHLGFPEDSDIYLYLYRYIPLVGILSEYFEVYQGIEFFVSIFSTLRSHIRLVGALAWNLQQLVTLLQIDPCQICYGGLHLDYEVL